MSKGLKIAIAVIIIVTIYRISGGSNNTEKANAASDPVPVRVVNYDSIRAAEENASRLAEQQEADSFYATPDGKKCKKLMDKFDCTQDDAVNLRHGKIWIGMTLDMVKYLRGVPNSVNISNYGDGNEYQACWEEYTPSCFYYGEDGVISAYN